MRYPTKTRYVTTSNPRPSRISTVCGSICSAKSNISDMLMAMMAAPIVQQKHCIAVEFTKNLPTIRGVDVNTNTCTNKTCFIAHVVPRKGWSCVPPQLDPEDLPRFEDAFAFRSLYAVQLVAPQPSPIEPYKSPQSNPIEPYNLWLSNQIP